MWLSSIPGTLPPRNFNYLGALTLVHSRVLSESPASAPSLEDMTVGRNEEVLKVFLPLPDVIPSQQLPTRTVNGVGGTLLSPTEAPEGLQDRQKPYELLSCKIHAGYSLLMFEPTNTGDLPQLLAAGLTIEPENTVPLDSLTRFTCRA